MKTKLDKNTTICPKCNADWDGGSIVDTFKKQRDEGSEYWKDYSEEQIEEYVKESYFPPYRWGRQIGIEVQGEYDGISYYQCPDCETIWDKFTGEECEPFKKLTDEKNSKADSNFGS
jgi:hypothetical protein